MTIDCPKKKSTISILSYLIAGVVGDHPEEEEWDPVEENILKQVEEAKKKWVNHQQVISFSCYVLRYFSIRKAMTHLSPVSLFPPPPPPPHPQLQEHLWQPEGAEDGDRAPAAAAGEGEGQTAEGLPWVVERGDVTAAGDKRYIALTTWELSLLSR